ncbi:patatin-like phospholipase family protein [Sphingomonas sp.]|uniref:patatin-like phospholipase family protein n=1 Tax=Sphingomonas sp. TaxID=28214 RepID=UPI001B089D4C|nr:patatin-like phospholipase family protein [Sphingomonas sp.]MBO9713654.1 patatin-like phospholipase family protein [Sphingomonas sp.]
MRIQAFLPVMLLAGLLAGCVQDRPRPIAGCNYRAIPMTVPVARPDGTPGLQAGAPGALGAGQEAPSDAFTAQIQTQMAQRHAIRDVEPGADHDQFLVLSGGGEHGAFGAGFFWGMDKVPTYDIVTGVSTGSLQSTLMFLANSPVPADRTDYRWVDGRLASQAPGEPHQFPIRPGTSNLGDLALAYSIGSESDLMTRKLGGPAGIVFKGSAAGFGPLKARLKALLTLQTLDEVGRQRDEEGRGLYVGVVNLDDGYGYAIDMTELGSRIRATRDMPEKLRLQDCYVEALLASSSVPPGVPPITLETDHGTSMYMDGGARFGVFLQQLLPAIGHAATKDARVTVIANNSLESGPWEADGKPALKWSAATFGLRAVDLLEGQVYRFSVNDAEGFGIKLGQMRMAYISNANLPGGEVPDDHRFEGNTCGAWRAIDAKAKPLQFHPNYMACLADYGRSRGVTQAWNRAVP